MRKQLRSLVSAALMFGFAAAAPTAQQLPRAARPAVALLDFDFGAIQPWWTGNNDLGKQVADMLVDALVNDGTFRVIERKRLEAVLNEQNFAHSERADPSARLVAGIGRAFGVQYLIVGSVTRFGLEQRTTSIGASLGIKLPVGTLGRNEGKGTVAITARIIDTSTGEILASAKGEGTSTRHGLQVDAHDATGGHGATLNLGASDYQVTVMSEAAEIAIKDAAAKLGAARARLN
jgi:curli biogenesis system outer membrane secretion channel CsgG